MIIVDRPPNFEQIKIAFPKSDGGNVIFAYAGDIYCPSGAAIPPALIAHEEVHLARQKMMEPCSGSATQWSGPDLWWQYYLEDSEFRYQEELLAHVAEFKVQRTTNDRNFGARLLTATALRLVASLYDYQPPRTLQQALKDLRQEIAK